MARDLLALLAFMAVVAAVALVGSLTTLGAGDAYEDLRTPGWAPPAWLFGPVWTALYAMIAVAGWLAWRSGVGLRDTPLVLYGVQLLLNGLWSPTFFALGWRLPALFVILALDAAVVATILLFWRRSRWAAGLLLPYLAWILFATGLNAAMWWLNR